MASNISTTTQSLTTAAEMRETTVMLMQPDANWEEYLTPAPMSIALLGELVFISSGTDFSIVDKNSGKKFDYIKYPESFRACLMQVCNSGWTAFNEAHKSMDRIRLHTMAIPEYIQKSVQILFNAPDNVIETILPSQLENIHSIADDCKILAENVEKKYLDVINLIAELLESITNAKLIYGKELENAKRNLAALKLREESAQTEKEQARKAMKAIEKEMEEAKETYKQAMDSLPSGWSIIGMNFVEGLSSSAIGLMNGAANIISKGKLFFLNNNNNQPEQQNTESTEKTEYKYADNKKNLDFSAVITACSRSPQILNEANNLIQFVTGNDIDWKSLYDPQNKMVKTEWPLGQFQRIRRELDRLAENEARSEGLNICDLGIRICEELGKHTPDKEWGTEETRRLVEDINKLRGNAVHFDTLSQKNLISPALRPEPPMQHKVVKSSSGQKSASTREIENAQLRIEQSSEQLKYARESHEKRMDNLAAKNKELTEILIEMNNCSTKEIEFDTTIKMLVKGLQAMGEVKEQWNKMALFFQMISSIISISLNKTLHNFALTSDKSRALAYNDRLFTKDLLYAQAFQASNIANMVNMISTTYTQVSNNYLMDRMSSLSRLMAMDPESPGFHSQRMELQNFCREAQDGIQQLVLRNRADYERKSQQRMAKIEGQLKAILPPDQPVETNKVKEIVQSVYVEDESSYY